METQELVDEQPTSFRHTSVSADTLAKSFVHTGDLGLLGVGASGRLHGFHLRDRENFDFIPLPSFLTG